MREIGSEFWSHKIQMQTNATDNDIYFLSGRTALRAIIDDIRQTRNFRKVLLPSYCCESMIEPFSANNIDVQFYQVGAECSVYPYENDADAVLLIDHFGYVNPENERIACQEKHVGKIVIYDATHKLDGNAAIEACADYSFCSYRKWFYCNCAKAIKYTGEFGFGQLKTNTRYIELRDRAATKKENYIDGLTLEKQEFLKLFSEAEKMLDEDYVGYLGVPVVFDVNEIAVKRKENAAYLIGELKQIPEIKLWRDSVQSGDFPMFVPILVDSLIRDDLRGVLIKERIYCPVHWPISSHHCGCNELYGMELSLICDQRYGLADMERMVKVIKNFFINGR